jgi:hypothetical protein
VNRVAVLATCIASLVPATAVQAQPSREASLHAFLQTRFRDLHADPDARYALAWADLNGDGRPEAIVYLLARDYCGTGGCFLYIYRATGRSWARVANISVSQPPIRMLNTSSHGWRDIGISQRELRRDRFVRYEARLRFNGRTYPLNPSIPPAERLTHRVAGRILVADSDRGRPLF